MILSMKMILLVLCFFCAFPAVALNMTALERAVSAAPIDQPTWKVYTSNRAENTRRAVRLGYNNFHHRVNTPQMKESDVAIARLISTQLQPLFEKIDELPNIPEHQQKTLIESYNNQFANILTQLAQLFYKNQFLYTNPLFLDDAVALEETLQIVQEALERGSF